MSILSITAAIVVGWTLRLFSCCTRLTWSGVKTAVPIPAPGLGLAVSVLTPVADVSGPLHGPGVGGCAPESPPLGGRVFHGEGTVETGDMPIPVPGSVVAPAADDSVPLHGPGDRGYAPENPPLGGRVVHCEGTVETGDMNGSMMSGDDRKDGAVRCDDAEVEMLRPCMCKGRFSIDSEVRRRRR